MSKTHLIARLVLTVLAIACAMYALNYLPFLLSAPSLSASEQSSSSWLHACGAVLCLVLCLWLISEWTFHLDKWTDRLAGPDDPEDDCVEPIWIIAGFRLVLGAAGLLILAWHVEFLVRAVAFVLTAPRVIVDMIAQRYIAETFIQPPAVWAAVIVRVLNVAIGIYLLVGTSHLIQWQCHETRLIDQAQKTLASNSKGDA